MEAMLQVVDQPCHQHWGHMGLSVSWGWTTWEGISRRGYRWLMVCRVPTQTKTKVHTPSYCIRQNPVQIWFVNSTWTTRGNHKASGTKNLVACLQILQIHMLIFLLGRYSCWVCYVICPHLAKKKKKKCKAARKHLFLDNTSAQADFLTFSACVWSVSHAERVWSDYHLDWTWPGIHLCTACFQAHSWLPDVNSLGEKICAAQEATRMSLF